MIALAFAWIGLALVGPPLSPGPVGARDAGLRGLIHDQGRWVSPEEVAGRDRDDPHLSALLAAYAERRSNAKGDVQGQRDLARWADRSGLKAEAVAHFTAVTRLEPDDAEARRRLGYRRQGGRWVTASEVAAESAEADAQVRADREWGPKFATWRRRLTEPDQRAEAVRGLAQIRDPRAVPTLRRSFGDRVAWEQAWAVKVLGQIDSPGSSSALAELSVFGLDEPIRLSALRHLLRRDPRPFTGMVINWLRDPIRYQVLAARGPDTVAGLRVEGEAAIVERTYSATPNTATAPPSRANPAGSAGLEGQQAVRTRQRADIREIDRSNVSIELTNARIERTLQSVTGVDLGQDRPAWAGWWTGELGYSYQSPPQTPKPIVNEEVRVAYTPLPPIVTVRAAVGSSHHACFGAGTPVLARSGPRPIEELRVGDQVLSQDPTSGELGFRPIVAIFHNPPAATLRVDLGGEPVVATPIHRFWLAARGWTMARDLRPGDQVRSLGGLSEVVAVNRDQVQPVFNLEVAGGHSFFVGRHRALVHDNSLVAPTTEPFDAAVRVAHGSGR